MCCRRGSHLPFQISSFLKLYIGFLKTGLGNRIATYFVKRLGKSTLGLSYGLVVSETLISPAMPSTTARAGGVFLPIIKSLSLAAESMPDEKSARKLGAYLVLSQLQVQHSIVDMRPQQKMPELCQLTGVQLLTYGTVMGGLLYEKFLDTNLSIPPLGGLLWENQRNLSH